MSGRTVDLNGVVYDEDTGQRIGVADPNGGWIVLDEDVYRDDGRYDEPSRDD